MTKRYVQVALPVPLRSTFTYSVPDGLEPAMGARVKVTFGRRPLVGIVASSVTASPPTTVAASRVRDIDELLDDVPLLSPELLKLARFIADYYLAPPGEAHSLLLPPRLGGGRSGTSQAATPKSETWVEGLDVAAPARLGPKMAAAFAWLTGRGPVPLRTLKAEAGVDRGVANRLVKRGLARLEERLTYRDPFKAPVVRDQAPSLTAEQRAAFAGISASLGGSQAFLLHGVTGSGKTEVYLSLIEATLERDQGVLVLAPEIALTPQLAQRFRARLGDRVAIQHSALAPEARQEQWQRIASGELRVVVGARSALFAPVPNLGLLVVDECHEPSFKQETSPRYHARDMALVRGRLEGATVVLGSATPSAETWANVTQGKLKLISLTERVLARPLPEVSLVDLREAPTVPTTKLVSQRLFDALKAVVERGEQAILFLNRRGFSSFLLCRTCGTTLSCSDCSVTYTWHRRRARMVCHYCDHTLARPSRCPECKSEELSEVGFGTEQVEDAVRELLPEARVGRMDRDTSRGNALHRLLTMFRAGDLDILIGTQMVAKGHDFPNVTLVGVMLAELGLGFPDFRGAERTFQLLTQIAGRAGRAEKPGKVLVQTYWPEHYAIVDSVTQDAVAFLERETTLRQARDFPPATRLALYRLSGTDQHKVAAAAQGLARHALSVAGPLVRVYPPQPAPLERIRGRFRYQVLLGGRERRALRDVLEAIQVVLDGKDPTPGVQVALDVDPYTFL